MRLADCCPGACTPRPGCLSIGQLGQVQYCRSCAQYLGLDQESADHLWSRRLISMCPISWDRPLGENPGAELPPEVLPSWRAGIKGTVQYCTRAARKAPPFLCLYPVLATPPAQQTGGRAHPPGPIGVDASVSTAMSCMESNQPQTGPATPPGGGLPWAIRLSYTSTAPSSPSALTATPRHAAPSDPYGYWQNSPACFIVCSSISRHVFMPSALRRPVPALLCSRYPRARSRQGPAAVASPSPSKCLLYPLKNYSSRVAVPASRRELVPSSEFLLVRPPSKPKLRVCDDHGCQKHGVHALD